MISAFSANPATIVAGQSSMLTWQVTGATTVTINNGVGPVSSGSVVVSPSGTTTYQLTAANAAGSVNAQATVTVTPSSNPASASDPNAPFTLSYRGADKDPATGKDLGGTEFRSLTSHKGRLFGGLEAFLDAPPPGSPVGTARIVVKDSATAPWRIDVSFDQPLPAGVSPPPGRPRIRNEGVTALASITFNTDRNARPLPSPITLLVAGLRDFASGLSIYVRNDDLGTWSENVVEPLQTTQSTVRSFGAFRDKVTGVDLLFIGGNPGGIYSAAYDPAQGLVFRRPAELANTPATRDDAVRPMAFAACDGDLFAVLAPYVYQRIDGPSPSWRVILDYSAQFNATATGSSGLRGLTCVKTPGATTKSLIAGFEGPGTVYRLDHIGPNWVLQNPVEYDANAALSAAAASPVTYSVLANNTFTPLVDPDSGDTNHLMTIQTRPNLGPDAWYALRSPTATYALKKISSAALTPVTPLTSTRTAIVSPFPEENGSVVYIGGFDVVDQPNHDSAYVLRAGMRTIFGNQSRPLNQQCPLPGALAAASGVRSVDILPSTVIGATQWNAPNVVVTHATAPSTQKLVVFLAGSNGAPGGYRAALAVAARLGHRVIGLTYPNSWTIDQLCANSPDPDCDRKVRIEIITGQDVSPLVQVDRTNSIENRLKTLLVYLRTQQPGLGWDDFLAGDVIQWDKIIVAGHSQGGGHAALIGRLNAVNRVAMFAAPADYDESRNTPAPWLFERGLTPTSAQYGFVQRDDPLVRYTPIWAAMGLPAYGPQTVVDGAQPPYGCTRQLITQRTPVGGGAGVQLHNFVVVDGATPVTNGEPDFAPVWALMFGK
ncbi:MAG: hypothetical protein K2X34_08860 [Hyphomonadaceae bacterium]|nr:hypothetical protein [Hyphomonadaceae bacterium]